LLGHIVPRLADLFLSLVFSLLKGPCLCPCRLLLTSHIKARRSVPLTCFLTPERPLPVPLQTVADIARHFWACVPADTPGKLQKVRSCCQKTCTRFCNNHSTIYVRAPVFIRTYTLFRACALSCPFIHMPTFCCTHLMYGFAFMHAYDFMHPLSTCSVTNANNTRTHTHTHTHTHTG